MRRAVFFALCAFLIFSLASAQTESESTLESEPNAETSTEETTTEPSAADVFASEEPDEESASIEPASEEETASEENEPTATEGTTEEEPTEESGEETPFEGTSLEEALDEESGEEEAFENEEGGEEEEEEEEEECEEESGGSDVILVLFFMLLLGLVVRYSLQRVPVPYTALLLVFGMLLGAMQINLTRRPELDEHEEEITEEGEATSHVDGGRIVEGGHGFEVGDYERWEKFAIGINAWQSLEPELMLLVFLPALIFSSAFSLDFHITKKSFGQCLLLAGPGVIIGTVLTAFFTKFVFPYGWCWPKAFMFGAMISATDPVAVVALLKEVGASKRLGTVIEGESLLNDGTAFVFFLLFRDMIPTHGDCLNDKNNCQDHTIGQCASGNFEPTGCLTDRDFGESIKFFLQLAFGGPAIGILFGFAATFWITHIYNDLLTEVSVTLTTAYLTFYVAEDTAGVSGVLATVALGMFMGSFAKDRISPHVHEAMHVFWEMMEYVANTLIFVYTGLKLAVELFDTTNPSSQFINAEEWGYGLLLYIALQIIRLITVFSLLPLLDKMGYGMTWKDALVAVWGGLRGAVGLALALIVELDTEHIPPSFRSYTIFYLGFIVILTLLINGTTMPYLLKALGVTKTSPEKLEVLFHLLNEMEDTGDKMVMNGEDDLLGIPDYEEIKRLTELDISKIVPTAREIESVMEIATEQHRPASLAIQHGLNQRNLARYLGLDPTTLAGIVEEERSDTDTVVNVDKDKDKNKGIIQRTREYLASSSSKSMNDDNFREDFTPDMLVQDLRNRLLQGVKTAYGEWLEKGYINAKAMFDLIESADNAIDHLEDPISDWKYLEKTVKPSWWRVEIQKLNRHGCKGCVGELATKTISKLFFDSMMYSVLLARTYIMAHTEAEHTLQEHIKREMGNNGRTADPRKVHLLVDSAEMILKESQQATKTAYELMRNFKMVYPEILRAIKTRLTAQEVLLEKAAYVHQIESAGLIENREATVIREMIDSKLKYLAYNSLMSDLPNGHDLLHSHALFIGMPKNLFDSVVWPHAKPKVFNKGSKIYTLGGEPKHVSIVVRGLVKMVDSAGVEAPIGDGFGSVLGVSEIMLNRPRAVTMQCETTSEVIQIDRQIFESLVGRFLSVRTRSWQLTGMMLTYLNPWGDFMNASILDLANIFKKAQVLEFEPDQELRVRTRSYLISGTVKEVGYAQGRPQTIVAPTPLGPGLGIYTCVTEVIVLRIPMPEAHGHSTSNSFDNTRRMLARSSGSMSMFSVNMPTGASHGGPRSSLLEIPENKAQDLPGAPSGERMRHRNHSRNESFDFASSADFEPRAALARRIRGRPSIEF